MDAGSEEFHLQPERKMNIIIIITSVCLFSGSSEINEEQNLDAEAWLQRYGYLTPSGGAAAGLRSAPQVSAAISAMQHVYGLEPSGRMDATTAAAMRRPRCALPDRRPERESDPGRRRRYAVAGQRWDRNHITYSLMRQQIPLSLGEERTYDTVRRAFAVWTQVTPLTFEERPAGAAINGSQAELSDILLLFASGYHGDMFLFDGEGGALGHAYYPGLGVGGDTHFDADEPWTLDNEDQKGIDFFLVAVHELGHALGLEHSENPGAAMAPFYQWTEGRNFTLHEDDVRGIQWLYGAPLVTEAPPTSTPPQDDESNETSSPSLPSPSLSPDPSRTSLAPPTQPDPSPAFPVSPPPSTPTISIPEPEPEPAPPPPRPPSDPPDICDGGFDTVTLLRGEMFVFKGRWFWRVRRNRVLDNYPMPISVFWNGLPDDIDAAYERHDGKFVFFKGDRYWLFREADVLPGYPQPLQHYGRGIPTHRIDTAVWWEPNGFTYFFSGDRYWRYNEETRTTDRDFPKPISRWGNIPASPRGAFLSEDGASTFFYKGSSYWRFDNRRTEADAGFPRSILKDFMGCVGIPDPKPDPDAGREPEEEPVEPTEPSCGPEEEEGPGGTEEDQGRDVNVVVTVASTESKVMTLILVTVPLVLVLCILVLIYAILRTLQNKETPRALVRCKRSLQAWV